MEKTHRSFALGQLSGALALAAACGLGCFDVPPGEITIAVSAAMPFEASCQPLLGEVRAEAWVSGMNASYELEVDTDLVASGDMEGITSRIDRDITVDFYAEESLVSPPVGVESPYRLLLAQAVKFVELADPEAERIELSFAAQDFITEGACLDQANYNEEAGEPATTVDHFAAGASPCDLDDDGSSNIDELCADADPFAS